MAGRIGRRRRAAIGARCIFEAIEARTYLSVAFDTPSILAVNGARAPIEISHFASGGDDVAVATSNSVKILSGNSNGTLKIDDSIPLPSNPVSTTPFLVGESGEDSLDDIVLLSQAPTTLNGVSTQEGIITYETRNSDDTYTAGSKSFITDAGFGFVPIYACNGNFSGDGLGDLAVVGKTGSGGGLVVAIMTNNGDGTFTESNDLAIAGSNASGNLSNEFVAGARFGGGNADIVVYDGSGGNLDVFMNGGANQFTQVAPVALKATLITVGAFNNSNEYTDVAVADGNHLTVMLSNSDGAFTAQAPMVLGGTINFLAVGDVNADEDVDLVTNLGVQLGNGSGTFGSPTALPVLGGGAVFSDGLVAADINGNRREDLIGLSSSGNAVGAAINITPAPTSNGITSSGDPSNPGEDVTFTATVQSRVVGTPTGTVEFFDGSTDLGNVPLVDGSATFDAGTGLVSGLHMITVQYSGDSSYAASTSYSFGQSITAPTSITISSNQNVSNVGDDVTFTATISGNDGSGDAIAGIVDFFDGTTQIGSVAVDGNSEATLDIGSLSVGSHEITAQYQGNAHFAPTATTSAVALTVMEPSLVPAVSRTTIGTSVVGKTAVHGDAIVSLTNESFKPITGRMTVTIFASGNGLVDDSTLVLGSSGERNMTIRGGATVNIRVPINVASLSLAAGSYALLGRVSYGKSLATNAATGPALAVAAPIVALSNVLMIREFSTVIGGSKTRDVATVQITNQGNIASVGPVTMALFVSDTQNVAETQFVSITKNLSIRPGAERTVEIPLKMFPVVSDGTYFVVLQTTDPQGNTAVISAGTRLNIAAPLVTLSASIGSVEPTFVSPGESVSVVVTISNSGNIDADGLMTFDLGVSSDGETIASVLADVVGKLNLPPESKQSFNITFKIPLAATPGIFFPAVSVNQDGNTASAIGTTRFTIS